ncbi:unnamed protein product [Parnassius apollo]|uniref:(apollo) hypothetical protein n=1 Tax=Parnassius apollo TaxID=110799 RepID=A0A8S3Y9X4_PARAO|nr:unnamed protein product [Parnassius apollo]
MPPSTRCDTACTPHRTTPDLPRCVHCTDTASVGGDAATAKMPPSTRCDTACTPHRTTPTCRGAYTVLRLQLLVLSPSCEILEESVGDQCDVAELETLLREFARVQAAHRRYRLLQRAHAGS